MGKPDRMSLSDLAIRWIGMAILTIVSGLWRGQKLSGPLLGGAFLAASIIAGIAALYPLTKLPGLWGVGVTWLRNFSSMCVLVAVLTKYSPRRSIVTGMIYATLLVISKLLW